MSNKILIVDDEMDIVRVIAMRLRASGYEVLTASDGIAATQMAMRNAPDLIIMDIGMPGGDGHVIAERLSNDVKTMGTPIIFLTARISRADEARAKAAGAFAYLTKPFMSGELLDAVSRGLVSVGK
jgi:DNA-binding response OmpR family regulator